MYLLLSAWAVGATQPATDVSALEQTSRAMREIKTLEVRMLQTKELAVFGDKQQARGTLVFARPRRLRIDLEGAGAMTLVVRDSTMALSYKALQRTERFDLNRDPRARAIAEHLFLLLEADIQAMRKVYTVDVQSVDPLRVRLTPKPEAMRRLLAFVDAQLASAGYVERLVLGEANGDRTVWGFSEPRINRAVDLDLFKVP